MKCRKFFPFGKFGEISAFGTEQREKIGWWNNKALSESGEKMVELSSVKNGVYLSRLRKASWRPEGNKLAALIMMKMMMMIIHFLYLYFLHIELLIDKIAKDNRDKITILSRGMTGVQQVIRRMIWPWVMCRVVE